MWSVDDILMPSRISQRAHDIIELGGRVAFYIHAENEKESK